MSEAHIFVVEDEESFVDALEVGLAREGFTVSVARDGLKPSRSSMRSIQIWFC